MFFLKFLVWISNLFGSRCATERVQYIDRFPSVPDIELITCNRFIGLKELNTLYKYKDQRENYNVTKSKMRSYKTPYSIDLLN